MSTAETCPSFSKGQPSFSTTDSYWVRNMSRTHHKPEKRTVTVTTTHSRYGPALTTKAHRLILLTFCAYF